MKEKTRFSFLLSLDSLLKSMSFFSVCKTSLPQPLPRTKIYILGSNDLLMNCWLSASSCILKTELVRQAYIQTFYRLTFFFPLQCVYLKTAYLPEFALLAKILYQTATFYCCYTSWITALFDGKWDAPSCMLSINISELFNFLLIV